VPRDLALNLTQAASRVWVAFVVEAGYFGGGLLGFVVLAAFGKLHTAETVMLVNMVSAAFSAVIGLCFEPCILHPGKHGNWKEIVHVGRWIGVLSLGEVYLQQGDALIVGIFFSAEMIAPYIAARTLLRMYTLLSQAINFLVLPHASRSMANGRIPHFRGRVRMVIKWLLLLLVPINLLIWISSPWLFPAILGAKYELAVPFFRFMILATFFEPIYSVLSNAIVGIGKPQKVVPVQLTGLILNVVMNFILLPLTGLKAAAMVLVATYGSMAFLMRRLARTHLVPEESLI
jgi:O-antigen/teichoic acid export membrane protein